MLAAVARIARAGDGGGVHAAVLAAIAIIVTGISWREEIFIIRKVHISRLAVPGGTGVLREACRPAAFLRDFPDLSWLLGLRGGRHAKTRKFAIKFMEIDSYAG